MNITLTAKQEQFIQNTFGAEAEAVVTTVIEHWLEHYVQTEVAATVPQSEMMDTLDVKRQAKGDIITK